MNKKHNEVELLAPAGSYESMVAAINAGADAVYVGGGKFGARAFAANLDEESMVRAIDFVHLHHKKIYLTVNTLLKEDELSELYGYLKPFYEQGLDAVIVQDMGVLKYIRRTFPLLPIHASTQMTITGAYGARLLEDYGVSRIVTARELSLEEIRSIHESTDMEIETFIHGALCYGYSGQCLFSSLIGGRSGNRGRCAQPCRLPYRVFAGGKEQKFEGKTLSRIPVCGTAHTQNGKNRTSRSYVLNLKDLCTLDILPDLIDAGVYSMKIEGRMKSPRYTAGVVSIYRKYIDLYLSHGRKGYQVVEEDKKMLLELFDRGGLTEGYFNKHFPPNEGEGNFPHGRDMIALQEKPAFRKGNQELFDYLDREYVNKVKKGKIKGKVKISKDIPAIIELVYSGTAIMVEGKPPVKAKSQPLTPENLRKQMEKTGNTPFVFESLEISLEDQLFMPVLDLNELRRSGLQELEKAVISKYHRDPVPSGETTSIKQSIGEQKPGINVLIEETMYIEEVLQIPEVSVIEIDSVTFLPSVWKDTVTSCHIEGKQCYLVLPHIFRKEALQHFQKHLVQLKEAGFDGFIIKSLEELSFLKENRIEGQKVADHNLYTFNQESIRSLEEMGIDRTTAPVELNYKELLQRGCSDSELIVYGYLPMMVSAQCIKNTAAGCYKKQDSILIKDRLGIEFPVKNRCIFCFNTIYNSSPLSLLDNKKEIERLNPKSIRLQFALEQKEEIRPIIRLFADSMLHNKNSGDFGFNITRGHFKRGVE